MKLSTDQFIWHSDIKTFTNDASSLNLAPGNYPRRIELRSARTGRTVNMELCEVLRTDDEVQGWKYRLISNGRNINGVVSPFALEIFND